MSDYNFLLMYDRLPELVNPLRLADRGAELQGRIDPVSLERLGTMLAGPGGSIELTLRFGRETKGPAIVAGELAAQVELLCQRCMKPFLYSHSFEFRLGVVEDEEQAERLPEGLEPLVVIDEQLRIADLVEDELILGLPLIPMHEATDCNDELGRWQIEGESSKENPFSVLEGLKDKLDRH